MLVIKCPIVNEEEEEEKKKKKKFHLAVFAVLADHHSVKIKESEKTDKSLDPAKELRMP